MQPRRTLQLLTLTTLMVGVASCATEPLELNVAPCYEQYRVIPLDAVTELGLAPRDAVGRYSALFQDGSGVPRTVDIRLLRPATGWVRDIVREARYGYTETPACDVRMGVELEIEIETGDQWFAERFHAAAVRSTYQDAWLVRALRPLGAIEGEWPDKRDNSTCSDVDVGFSLMLDGSASGGQIIERRPDLDQDADPCFREILSWDLDADGS